MKQIFFILIVLSVFILPACKKTRVCECKNSNGTYVAGEIDATKAQARKHCKSLSSSSTDCYMK